MLVNADPRRFFVPPYVGHKGWVGVRLTGKPDWDEIARIVERSYRLVAPKRLAALSPLQQGSGAAVAPRRIRARRK